MVLLSLSALGCYDCEAFAGASPCALQGPASEPTGRSCQVGVEWVCDVFYQCKCIMCEGSEAIKLLNIKDA